MESHLLTQSHLSTVLMIALLIGVPFLLTRDFTLNRLRPKEEGSGFVHESKKQVHCVGAFLRAIFSGAAAAFALHALFASIFGVFSSGETSYYLNSALFFILPQSGQIIDKFEHRFQIVRSLLTGGTFDKATTVGIPLAKTAHSAQSAASAHEANSPRQTNRWVRTAPAQAGFGKRVR